MEVGDEDKITELELRPCNITDTTEMLFEPDEKHWSRKKLGELSSYMLCLDDPSLVTLNGQI